MIVHRAQQMGGRLLLSEARFMKGLWAAYDGVWVWTLVYDRTECMDDADTIAKRSAFQHDAVLPCLVNSVTCMSAKVSQKPLTFRILFLQPCSIILPMWDRDGR